MLGFIGFTRHGVTKDFESFNAFMTPKQMKGNHTSVAIVAEYENVFELWKILVSKVSCNTHFQSYH